MQAKCTHLLWCMKQTEGLGKKLQLSEALFLEFLKKNFRGIKTLLHIYKAI